MKPFAEDIATKEGFKNFKIGIKVGKNKGDGFLGDVFMVTIQEDERSLEIVIKCAYTNKKMVKDFCMIKDVYDTEKYFYESIYPALDKFQTQMSCLHPFKSVAKYYGSHFEGNVMLLAFENLRTKGFDLFDKKELFDEEHTELLLEVYAKYHATAFAFKELCPEEYDKLVQPVECLWLKASPDDVFLEMARLTVNDAFEALVENGNELLIEKLTEFKNRTVDILLSAIRYQGKYSCLLHGDCWSNNMMFKYSVS